MNIERLKHSLRQYKKKAVNFCVNHNSSDLSLSKNVGRNLKEIVNTFPPEDIDKIHSFLESMFPGRYDYNKEGVMIYYGDIDLVINKTLSIPVTDIYVQFRFDLRIHLLRGSLWYEEAKKGYYHPHASAVDPDRFATNLCFGGLIMRADDFLSFLVSASTYIPRFISNYNPKDAYHVRSSPTYLNTNLFALNGIPNLLLIKFTRCVINEDIDIDISEEGVSIIPNQKFTDFIYKHLNNWVYAEGKTVSDYALEQEFRKFNHTKIYFRDEEIKTEIRNNFFRGQFNKTAIQTFKRIAERFLTEHFLETFSFYATRNVSKNVQESTSTSEIAL